MTTPFTSDYHIHTKWCGHASGETRDYVEAAVARGLTEIGFADHLPVPCPVAEKLYMNREELANYVAEVTLLQAEYAGRIRILLAGECDFAPGKQREIEAAIAAFPLDYVIGSTHFINGWAFDHPAYRAAWDGLDPNDAFRRYYKLIEQAAHSGYYDVIGHLDLPKKFGYRPSDSIIEAEIAAADAIAKAGLAVEINTSGFDVPAAEQYPSERILRLLFERNVPICFGSDSHRPEHIARHFDRARSLARSLGWNSVVRFEGRRRFSEPLA